MKCRYIWFTAIFSCTCLIANAQNYSLLPEQFFLHKGDKLTVHLINGEQFNKDEESKYQAAETAGFAIYEGSKKIDASHLTKDGEAPVLNYDAKNAGLTMLDLSLKPAINEVDRDKFLKYLDDEGLVKIADKAKNSNLETFRERTTWFIKTLVAVDKTGGGVYDKPLGNEYEIILQQNPYKKSYGDDITAIINYKGKPLTGAAVTLYVRTLGGHVFADRMVSDNTGEVYFKLSREGIYMLHAIFMELPKDRAADFQSYNASFTFAFSSTNEMPNTYREFGFGNKH